MKFFAILLFIIIPKAFASYTTAQLVDLINNENLKSIEEIIERLPKDLRENYTLQYKGGGLQEGSFEFPRAILFGSDSKFILTFNGSNTQKKFNSLEILEYNEKLQEFELYELILPSDGGELAYPQKNPTACMQCHSTPNSKFPFPIWGRYPFWSGVYGSNDDQLYGKEKAEYERNKLKWKVHPRYKYLINSNGSPVSPVSPFSNVQNQNLSFRPNNNIGVFLARLNAKVLANKIRKKENFEKYLLLASPSFFHCKNELSTDDFNYLNKKLEKDFIRSNLELPIPYKDYTSLENISYLMGTNTYAWGMLSYGILGRDGAVTNQTKVTDPYFFDGFFMTTPNYVLSELSDEFFAKYPRLKKSYKIQPLYKVIKSDTRLIKTQRDRDLAISMDDLGVPLNLNKSSCRDFLDYLKEEFLR